MMIDRRLIEYFDWWMLALVAIAGALGVLTLYSAVHAGADNSLQGLFTRQLVWYGFGTIFMLVALIINYKVFERWALLLFLLCLGLLVAVLFFGTYGGGSKRWLSLGPISVQPSELVKLAVIIVLAKYYARVARPEGLHLRDLLAPILATALPFLLIVIQPDLGTAMVVFLIAGSITLYVKIERKTLICMLAGGALAIPLVWSLLKGYQKQRLLTLFNPERDPLGAGYHIIQSKIAIGSGMLTGKGFLKGTQNALDFLPEQHTDFVFSVFAEEWGAMGSLVMLAVFLLIIVWGLQIAHHSRDPFGTILSVGVTSMIGWQVFINIGMVMGLLPVVGVTLPFVSYGGSSIITMMAGVGLLLNVSMRRFMFEN